MDTEVSTTTKSYLLDRYVVYSKKNKFQEIFIKKIETPVMVSQPIPLARWLQWVVLLKNIKNARHFISKKPENM